MPRTTTRLALAAIVCTLALGACTQKYKDKIASQKDELAKQRIDLAELAEERDDLESAVTDLTASEAACQERVQNLEARIQALVEYVKEVEAELERLGGDKAAMADKYKEALAEQQRLLDEMAKEKARAEARMKTLRDMLAQFRTLIEGGKLNVRIRDGKLMLELPSAVLFPSGSAEVSEDGLATLEQVGAVLAKIRDREFQVAGHTDNVPIRSGRFEDNWELSTARSVAVVRALAKMGVKPVNLSASGYSQYHPVAPNDSRKNKAQNRRIEIILMPNLDELPDLSELEREIGD